MICIKSDGFGMLLRFAAEGSSAPVVLVGMALGLAMIVGILYQRSSAQATQRMLAAAEIYAEREIARDPRIPAREFLALAWPGR